VVRYTFIVVDLHPPTSCRSPGARCYWHAHGCHRSTKPKSRRQFWQEKFDANKLRDERKVTALLADNWRVFDVWECSLRGKTAREPQSVARAVRSWLRSSAVRGEIAGDPTGARLEGSRS
jgi:DNA mismatch endonuclease (patch repair protein)